MKEMKTSCVVHSCDANVARTKFTIFSLWLRLELPFSLFSKKSEFRVSPNVNATERTIKISDKMKLANFLSRMSSLCLYICRSIEKVKSIISFMKFIWKSTIKKWIKDYFRRTERQSFFQIWHFETIFYSVKDDKRIAERFACLLWKSFNWWKIVCFHRNISSNLQTSEKFTQEFSIIDSFYRAKQHFSCKNLRQVQNGSTSCDQKRKELFH